MAILRSAFSFAALAFLWTACGNARAQKAGISGPIARPKMLSLDFKNNRQHLDATVGERIEITLGTVGPNHYGDPKVSSPAIRLESTALAGPVNPGGPTYIYMFDAAAQGEARIKFPYVSFGSQDSEVVKRLTFTLAIRVAAGAGKPSSPDAWMTPDQANTAPWKNAWMNVHSLLRQTFTPSLPTLTAVEVELVAANPGPARSEVTMILTTRTSDGSEEALADVSKSVPVADCGHVLFLLPKGGLRVSPGEVYSISLSSVDSVFGWKYVVDGYPNGVASFQGSPGKPLSPNYRSTFLFRTFGAN